MTVTILINLLSYRYAVPIVQTNRHGRANPGTPARCPGRARRAGRVRCGAAHPCWSWAERRLPAAAAPTAPPRGATAAAPASTTSGPRPRPGQPPGSRRRAAHRRIHIIHNSSGCIRTRILTYRRHRSFTVEVAFFPSFFALCAIKVHTGCFRRVM